MGQRTKIDWADATWNPVTGCLHGCEYCYARRIAQRFGGFSHGRDQKPAGIEANFGNRIDLATPLYNDDGHGRLRIAPYPYCFTPTFHRYKLDEPQKWKKPRTIFVCSMADLFGEWVPEKWILDVFEACAKAPQHRYLFLTKNPARLLELGQAGLLPMEDNMWYGTSITRADQQYFFSDCHHTFLSIEPIMEEVIADKRLPDRGIEWIIVGAETGRRSGKIVPKRDWITDIELACTTVGIPIFMKDSLRELMDRSFKQKFPWRTAV